MGLILSDSLREFIEIGDGTSILVDYLDVEQQNEISRLSVPYIDLPKTEREVNGKIVSVFDFNSMSTSQKADVMEADRMIMAKTLKYTIKDWKGVFDQKGEPVKCKLTNGNRELDGKLWNMLCRSLSYEQMQSIYLKIMEKVGIGAVLEKK